MAWDLSNYEDVASRVKRFQEAYPMGRIIVKVLDYDKTNKAMLIEASVYRTDAPDELPAATDIALEWASKSKISAMWWAENAATSAIGRAISSVLPTENKATLQNMQQVKAIETFEADPWAVATKEQHISTAVEQLQEQMGGEVLSEAPICGHGHMIKRESKSDAPKEWCGYFCTEKTKAKQCDPIWMIRSATTGQWRLP